MATAEKPKPTDIAEPDCWPCWHACGWEQAHEYSMVDASDGTTRAEARSMSTDEIGDWTEIGVWKRYVRFRTRQEVWVSGYGNSPVPDDWRPTEDDWVWEFVPRSHPDARPYWVVGLLADGAPPVVVREEDGNDER